MHNLGPATTLNDRPKSASTEVSRVDNVSERYLKLLQKREFRLEWAERIGLGFELPGTNLGQLGQLVQFRKVG